MADTPEGAARELRDEGEKIAVKAFKLALGNVEAVAKALSPVGHYGRRRGKAGKAGGGLQGSLAVRFVGLKGGALCAVCESNLPYARAQHEKAFHHPGMYTGAAGPIYSAAFFTRGIEIVFGGGADPVSQGPRAPRVATFGELLTGQ